MRKRSDDYSVLKAMRNALGENRDVQEFVRLPGTEVLSCILTDCVIHEDWVNEIENGLDFIRCAIDEARRFIKQNGEVVRIDQVKQVSKESVRHLAQHSNLITHRPDSEKIPVPDALLVMEKTDNYCIYENRFLFTLLSYLSAFVEERCRKISYWRARYEANCCLEHEFHSGERDVKIAWNCSETGKLDGWSSNRENEQDTLWERIQNIRIGLASLLQTPLMKEVAPSGMLSGAIQRTNVMKMNPGFKGATALYDFIRAYSGDGFEVIKKEKNISPFSQKGREDAAIIASLQLFIMRFYGTDAEKNLIKESEREEEVERQQEVREKHEKISRLKECFAEKKITPEEYILELENSIDVIGQEAERAADWQRQNEATTAEKENLLQTASDLRETVEQLKKSLDVAEHEGKEAKKASDIGLTQLSELRSQVETLEKTQAEREKALSDNEQKARESLQENLTALAELHALRQKYHEWDDGVSDFSERERFLQLTAEWKAMQTLYNEQKRLAKKKIRSRIFGELRTEHKS